MVSEIIGSAQQITTNLMGIYKIFDDWKSKKNYEQQLYYMVYLEAKINKNLIQSIKMDDKVNYKDEIYLKIIDKFEYNYLSILVLNNYYLLKQDPGYYQKYKVKLTEFFTLSADFIEENENENEIEVQPSKQDKLKSKSFEDACEFLFIKFIELKKLRELNSITLQSDGLKTDALKRTNFKLRISNIEKALEALIKSIYHEKLKIKEQ